MIYMTIEEIALELVGRIKAIRKVKNISQLDLAKQSNVSYGSIKRFERTGEISLFSLIKICVTLDIEKQLLNLFEDIPFSNIEEVIKYGKYIK